MKYETYENESGKTFVKRFNDDGSESHIPADPANSDYQRYLAWLENPEAEHFTPIVTDAD
jgi:hypothetical protein